MRYFETREIPSHVELRNLFLEKEDVAISSRDISAAIKKLKLSIQETSLSMSEDEAKSIGYQVTAIMASKMLEVERGGQAEKVKGLNKLALGALNSAINESIGNVKKAAELSPSGLSYELSNELKVMEDRISSLIHNIEKING